MKTKKITAVLLIALMLISFLPVNITAIETDSTSVTVKVDVFQKNGGNTDFIKTYTLYITKQQSDALKPLKNIPLTNALYPYGVLADFLAAPVTASDVVNNGQIRYDNDGYNKYEVTIVLKGGTLPSCTITFTAGPNGAFETGDKTVFNNIACGTDWEDAVDVPDTVANRGYRFDKWIPSLPSDDTGVIQNATYTATFKTRNYDIDYHLNKGTNNHNNPDSYTIEDNITLLDPTRSGYVFAGWYDNEDFHGSPVTQIQPGSTGDKDFYAKWINRFSVKFQAGEHGSLNGKTVYNNIKYGTKWKDAIDYVPAAVADTGYIFDCWTPSIPLANSEIKNDATYTATFKPISYDITYVLNGGLHIMCKAI